MNMRRREFIAGAAGAVAAIPGLADADAVSESGLSAVESSDVPQVRKTPPPPRNRRPYAGLDWSKVKRIKTTTHGHCPNPRYLEAYLKRGFGLLTVSNYYPSAPWVPLSEMTEGFYRVHHNHAVTVNGKKKDGPFDWTKIVGEWKDELGDAEAAQLPFQEGKKIFPPLPPDVLEAPNAEHHNFLMEDGKVNWMLHMCAPGSNYASGTFDVKYKFKTHTRGYCYGSGEYWGTAVDRMIDALAYPDGGGVTINHPTWSKLDRELILRILDHDPRVLGIEAVEGRGYNNENYWDWVLSTGRQCFGFFVPDWAVANGKVFGVNVLCVEERTVHACMKAYRDGNFYGALNGLDELAFERISFDGNRLEAATDRPARFEVVTAQGVVARSEGREVSWVPPAEGEWSGRALHMFARVRAFAADDSGEVLFTQPFMLT